MMLMFYRCHVVNINLSYHISVSLTWRVQRPRGRSPQQCTVIRVQLRRPAVEASLGRVSNNTEAVPAGESRLMERSPRHTLLRLTLTW